MADNGTDSSWRRLAALVSFAASVTVVLTWFGISGSGKASSRPTTTGTTANIVPAPVTGAPPASTYSSPAVTTSSTTSTPATSPSSSQAFDPSELDDVSTDPTPFTTYALIPPSFTDSENDEYSLQSQRIRSCINLGMSRSVASVLNEYGCTEVVTGQYTESSGTSDGDILVSVQVFAFNDRATAQQIVSDFPSNTDWHFGYYCPVTGDGAAPCDPGVDTSNATYDESLTSGHRYVIEATAIYTDLRQNNWYQPYVESAAQEAADISGPAYYISQQ